MEQARTGSVRLIGPVEPGQFHRRLAAAENVGHPLFLHQRNDYFFQFRHGKIFPVGIGPVKAMGPDEVRHGLVQEFPGAAEGDEPPQVRGGNGHHGIFQHGNFGSHGLQFGFLRLDGLPLALFAPVHHRQSGILQDAFRLAPGIEGQEHIRAHEQGQFRIPVRFPQLGHGLIGIAAALAAHFQIADLQARLVLTGQTQHTKPLLRRGGPGRDFFVGRQIVRDHQQPG